MIEYGRKELDILPKKDIALLNADEPNNKLDLIGCVYDEISTCPRCHYALVPQALGGVFANAESNILLRRSHTVDIFMFCPRCRQVFLAEYSAERHPSKRGMLRTKMLLGLYPSTPQLGNCSPQISGLSPMFAEIYSQSEAASDAGLMEIAGCGYRKSIEYLIKDYLCHKDPKNSTAIKGEFLGNSIQRIDDPRIKTLAERATWIGNDETHYVRKHENLDIEDMKRFIDALLRYVEAELTFEEALSVPHK